ncbi:MAG TPA: GAF domain-containing protein [Vicinamibacteria bacterium]|nr:GAF domain-containing protein [Vicinamibacteria bacterium]
MKKDEKDHGQYVRKVKDEAQRYSHELLSENERLRRSVAVLEADLARNEAKTTACEALAQANAELRAVVAELEAEKVRLSQELHDAREALSRQHNDQLDLEGRLRLAEEDNQRFAKGYGEVERQSENLANLYVASYSLHGTLDRKEVVRAIQEILANLVGCEEMAIFELDPEARVLRLTGSFGIEPDAYREIALGSGLIGASVATGQVLVAGPDTAGRSAVEANLTACIPITLEGAVMGAIALFRLLSHKPGLADVDREIFDLLAAQAGAALYCTKLHAERKTTTVGAKDC